ncbi:tRNA(Ile2) C34 agmatinyltransferase TiaS [Paraburkholderia caledonica]|uniref:tRNA(Ile2) C34 agmatinyltransferase TiaS n=1 Tax=Paraburkholderia caledonica TaxID=134536 RepID=A0AB73IFD6_9BURK|nr:tRNA(Ile2) C34 agmatinyltransferase TiaS [Paraburkholderia caledonica]
MYAQGRGRGRMLDDIRKALGLDIETESMKAHSAARREWLSERDPRCDNCSLHLKQEPQRPVYRCPKCMSCVAGMVGDPLFGFDLEKYREAPQNAG